MAPRPRPSARRRPVTTSLALSLAVLIGLAACNGEEAVPIDPANPPTTEPDLTGVTHAVEPTQQMQDLADQQCLDDPELDQGYVQAVDPDSGGVLSEVAVDCAEVRAGG